MRLLFVADGRSPIALNWIEYFIEKGHEVHLASTFACRPDPQLASYVFIPVAFSALKGDGGGQAVTGVVNPGAAGEARHQRWRPQKAPGGLWGAGAVRLRTAIRQWLGPLTLLVAAKKLHRLAEQVQPEIIHAMRIPYEGMLASVSNLPAPLVVSVWGNDFTLHAPSTPLMRRYTRWTMQQAAALHVDCHRDVRLAREWGFAPDRLAFVLPGNGGVQREVFYPPVELISAPVVIQPRGVRAYVQNRAFFEAIPLVLEECPQARFVCPNMAGEAEMRGWVSALGIEKSVDLLPAQTRAQMAELFRRSRVIVSPTTHDGTPNTLLEGLACGCLPVAGDLESIREWITPGINGLLVEPHSAEQIAGAVVEALRNDELCRRAREINAAQIAERADYTRVMAQVEENYHKLLSIYCEKM